MQKLKKKLKKSLRVSEVTDSGFQQFKHAHTKMYTHRNTHTYISTRIRYHMNVASKLNFLTKNREKPSLPSTPAKNVKKRENRENTKLEKLF